MPEGSDYLQPFCSCLWRGDGVSIRSSFLPDLLGEVILLPGILLDDSDNFEIALRRFKKQVEKAGVLSELKKRQHYEKPSVQEKKKKAAAKKRLIKKMRKSRID
jgi:small subunit ribosomal protein S21